jgi:hypothetical protein
VIQTSAAVSTKPTIQEPNNATLDPVGFIASSGIIVQVIYANATRLNSPATINPLYKAGITFLIPGEALTKKQPMIDAMIETPPKTRGYITASPCPFFTTSAPRTIVAINVTA